LVPFHKTVTFLLPPPSHPHAFSHVVFVLHNISQHPIPCIMGMFIFFFVFFCFFLDPRSDLVPPLFTMSSLPPCAHVRSSPAAPLSVPVLLLTIAPCSVSFFPRMQSSLHFFCYCLHPFSSPPPYSFPRLLLKSVILIFKLRLRSVPPLSPFLLLPLLLGSAQPLLLFLT